MKSIGYNAFDYCSSLTNVYYNGTIEDWCKIQISSYPMEYAQHFYIKNINNEYSEITEIKIPNTITHIGNHQFHGFNNITSIEIPDSVRSIGEGAFYDCSGLTNISISNSVTKIGNYVFNGCSSLTSIVIPNSVKSIENWAFSGCNSLTSIVIPESVTSIGKYAFHNCSHLTSVTFANTTGWFIATNYSSTTGTSMDVTNDKTNAQHITSGYELYYWKRS